MDDEAISNSLIYKERDCFSRLRRDRNDGPLDFFNAAFRQTFDQAKA